MGSNKKSYVLVMSLSWSPEIQKSRNSKIQKFKIQKFKNPEIQNPEIQKSKSGFIFLIAIK